MQPFTLNSFFTRCFSLICALAFIGVTSGSAAAATKVNFRIFTQGDQPSGQVLLFQATEKNKPLFLPNSSDPDHAYTSYSKGAMNFQQSLEIADPNSLNMSFLRIETAIPGIRAETAIPPINRKSVVQCHGYNWLNTALQLFLAKNPTTTELNIDITLSTTFLPNPHDNPRYFSPGIGGWGPDPDNYYPYPVFIEASACKVTFKINGVSFPAQ